MCSASHVSPFYRHSYHLLRRSILIRRHLPISTEKSFALILVWRNMSDRSIISPLMWTLATSFAIDALRSSKHANLNWFIKGINTLYIRISTCDRIVNVRALIHGTNKYWINIIYLIIFKLSIFSLGLLPTLSKVIIHIERPLVCSSSGLLPF